MDFSFSEEQKMLRDSLRKVLSKECPRDYVRKVDEEDLYPEGLFKRICALGFSGIGVPEEYGGTGGSVIDMMIVYEELSRVMPSLAWALGNVTLYGNEVILHSGSAEQKDFYLPKLVKGELKFAFALTEPEAGSDAANVATKAVLRDQNYLINGTKMFITGANVSDVIVTMARTGKSKYKGLTFFLVDAKSSGYSFNCLRKLGYHGASACELVFDDVLVPPTNILGGVACLDKGWEQMVKLLNGERLALAACALGIGQAAFDDALRYSKERSQFGQPIGRFQSIQHRLVDMATELEAARQLAYYAGWRESMHIDCVSETSMAKYFATETVKKIVNHGMQILGGYGYMMEFDMQRYLRDALLLTVGGGTSEIQKNIIGRVLGL